MRQPDRQHKTQPTQARVCSGQPLEKGKRDSHRRDKDGDSERQVILIESNNPLHGPHPAFGGPKDSLPTPPAASLWISFEHANCVSRIRDIATIRASVPRDQMCLILSRRKIPMELFHP
jgi:hypothetical protein